MCGSFFFFFYITCSVDLQNRRKIKEGGNERKKPIEKRTQEEIEGKMSEKERVLCIRRQYSINLLWLLHVAIRDMIWQHRDGATCSML